MCRALTRQKMYLDTGTDLVNALHFELSGRYLADIIHSYFFGHRCELQSELCQDRYRPDSSKGRALARQTKVFRYEY